MGKVSMINDSKKNRITLFMSKSISETINGFDVHDLVKDVEENNEKNGFVLFTEKQYVIGPTIGSGISPHLYTFARLALELERFDFNSNFDSINNSLVVLKDSELTKKYITARLKVKKNTSNLVPTLAMSIPRDYITSKEYIVIEKFFEDYKKDLAKLKFNFTCQVKGKGKHKSSNLRDNEKLLNFFKRMIDDTNVISSKDEPIIGTKVNVWTM